MWNRGAEEGEGREEGRGDRTGRREGIERCEATDSGRVGEREGERGRGKRE